MHNGIRTLSFTGKGKLSIVIATTAPINASAGGTKNEPAAYVKNTDYSMAAVVRNIYTPLHDFEYKLMALGRRDSLILDTEEQTCHLAFSNYDTITNISPRPWGGFPDCVGIIDSLSFQWAANKSMLPRYDSYRFITTSGPHKIYLTYDKPKLDRAHTLALDKICAYAQGESIDTVIAEKGVMGVYGEGWDYDPDKLFIYDDPLDVIRQTTGLCSDYANLLTVLYRSLGMTSNSTVIYNVEQGTYYIYRLFWNFVDSTGITPCCVLTQRLASCDDPVAKSWAFSYHAVARMNEYYCDATLGLFKRTTDYKPWWRYYLYPKSRMGPYLDIEPPSVPPDYRQVDYLINSQNIFPTNMLDYPSGHNHYDN